MARWCSSVGAAGGPAILALAVAFALALPEPARAQQVTTVGELAVSTHFHGIAAAPGQPDLLLLSTHHGLYGVRADGSAERISEMQATTWVLRSAPALRSAYSRAATQRPAATLA